MDKQELIALAERLTLTQRKTILLADGGGRPAGHFGWISSNATVRMKELRGIMARRYVGGRNLYYLTPNGLRVRDALRAIASQEGK